MLKLQLLTCYFHFKNLPCSTNNLLTVKAGRISVALNISGISRAIALDILNVFFLTKLSFTLVMVRSFFLLIHFLVVEDYELCKITSYILSVPLTLECVKILSSSISFFFSTLIVSMMMFCVRLKSELMILLSTHHVTDHLACCNKL